MLVSEEGRIQKKEAQAEKSPHTKLDDAGGHKNKEQGAQAHDKRWKSEWDPSHMSTIEIPNVP